MLTISWYYILYKKSTISKWWYLYWLNSIYQSYQYHQGWVNRSCLRPQNKQHPYLPRQTTRDWSSRGALSYFQSKIFWSRVSKNLETLMFWQKSVGVVEVNSTNEEKSCNLIISFAWIYCLHIIQNFQNLDSASAAGENNPCWFLPVDFVPAWFGVKTRSAAATTTRRHWCPLDSCLPPFFAKRPVHSVKGGLPLDWILWSPNLVYTFSLLSVCQCMLNAPEQEQQTSKHTTY